MALCSKEHGFIFVHIFRTGGSSIRKALTDLDTWEIGGWHWSLPQVKAHCMRNGLTEFYESAFKFAVVRNPFDWLVSLYHYRTGPKNPIAHLKALPFPEFAIRYCEEREGITEAMPAGANQLLTLSGFMDSCDGWIGFEDLHCFGEWSEDSIGARYDIPHINQSSRTKHYATYYTKTARDAVAEHFRCDLERFGYSF